MPIGHVCWRHVTHWTTIYRESTRCVLGIWNCRIRYFYDICAFSHSTYCGWVVNKLRYIGIQDTHAGDQLNSVLYVKNQELAEYVGGLVTIALCPYLACLLETWDTLYCDISRVHGMCVGIWNCHIKWFYDVGEVSHNEYWGWALSKTPTYHDAKYTCRGSVKCCVIC